MTYSIITQCNTPTGYCHIHQIQYRWKHTQKTNRSQKRTAKLCHALSSFHTIIFQRMPTHASIMCWLIHLLGKWAAGVKCLDSEWTTPQEVTPCVAGSLKSPFHTLSVTMLGWVVCNSVKSFVTCPWQCLLLLDEQSWSIEQHFVRAYKRL